MDITDRDADDSVNSTDLVTVLIDSALSNVFGLGLGHVTCSDLEETNKLARSHRDRRVDTNLSHHQPTELDCLSSNESRNTREPYSKERVSPSSS